MPKFTLIAEHYDEMTGDIESTVTHQFDKEYLPDVVMAMQEFLRGVGYYFDGELNISEDNEVTVYITPENAEKQECCGGCQGDTVQHNDHYYDINRNR